MRITTSVIDTAARITPHGKIDHATLPAAAAALPHQVTHLTWDLHDARFTDAAGLHLLADPKDPDHLPPRQTTVIGLTAQAQQLLSLAAEMFPAVDFAHLLQDAPDESAV
ncbi:hypothetical protein ACFQ6U_06195 [Streptomyces sp. NPDC056465]|uniref:hypothetical protein n=1 Tax=Streptomyces sp. NPDC056465 TaxID=3345829 RepID=UPI0036C99056